MKLKVFALSLFVSVLVSAATFLSILYVEGMSPEKNIKISNNEKNSELKDLSFYTIENLSKVNFEPRDIKVKELIQDETKFTSHIFSHTFSPAEDKGVKKVTGVINLPKQEKDLPVLLLIRGYVDKEIYSPGMGTKNVGYFFAKNGFITISQDFLEYGGSDKESVDIFEARFQKYTTVLSLLEAVKLLEKWDKKTYLSGDIQMAGKLPLPPWRPKAMSIQPLYGLP